MVGFHDRLDRTSAHRAAVIRDAYKTSSHEDVNSARVSRRIARIGLGTGVSTLGLGLFTKPIIDNVGFLHDNLSNQDAIHIETGLLIFSLFPLVTTLVANTVKRHYEKQVYKIHR